MGFCSKSYEEAGDEILVIYRSQLLMRFIIRVTEASPVLDKK